VRTPVVVETQIRPERGRAARRAAVRRAVGPFPQQGVDDAFRLAVGLRPVRPGEALPHGPPTADGREAPGFVGERVVGEQPADPDPATTEPREGALEKRRARGGIIGGEHLRIGEPGRIINRDMQILPARLPRAATAIAVDAMAHAHDAAEPFKVDVPQVADVRPFIALDRRGGLEQRDTIQAGTGEPRASPSTVGAAAPR
jgi:hypothetical protein